MIPYGAAACAVAGFFSPFSTSGQPNFAELVLLPEIVFQIFPNPANLATSHETECIHADETSA